MKAASTAAAGTVTIEVFGSRRPVILDGPEGIKPLDWIPDLGTLRQVDYIDSIDTLHIVHFKWQAGVPSLILGLRSGAGLTVWREASDG